MGMPTENLTRDFRDALASLDRLRAEALFRRALSEKSAIQAVEELVAPALKQIGQEWHEGVVALSQVYMSGRFCEELVERALPPSDPDRKRQPRSAIVVLDDYHALGKRIVYSILRASGFEVFDYGRMEADALVERAVADRIRVLLISVLMLPSALKVRAVRDALDVRGAEVKIAVGGAPFLFDPALWREVGADAMGCTAADALQILDGWMEKSA
jgi:methanogenic corrinoid protein MtbC1